MRYSIIYVFIFIILLGCNKDKSAAESNFAGQYNGTYTAKYINQDVSGDLQFELKSDSTLVGTAELFLDEPLEFDFQGKIVGDGGVEISILEKPLSGTSITIAGGLITGKLNGLEITVQYGLI